MKKIFSLIVLLAGVIAITSCKDEVASYQAIEPLEITSADVLFESMGGTGSIQVTSSSQLTAETTSPWIHLSVSGNKVTVTCDENQMMEGRSAEIVLKSGSKTANVVATQKGIVYGVVGSVNQNLNDKAQTVELTVLHSAAVNVESQADWITASFDEENNKLVFSVTANDSGWKRTGTIVVSSGQYSDVITVTQFDFITDFQGQYAFLYYSSSIGDYAYMLAEIAATSNTAGTLTFTSGSLNGMAIPITIDADNNSFQIANFGELPYTYTKSGVEYQLCTMVMMANGASIYRVKPAALPYCTASLVEEDGGVFFDFSATYDTYEFYALRIGYGTGGYDGYKGAYLTLPYCYMQKIDI